VSDPIIRRIVALFATVAAVLVVVAVVALRNISRATASNDWVNQTHAAILELGALRGSFQASDAALRTLLVTGSEQDEAACREASAAVLENLEVLRALLRSDRAAGPALERLDALAEGRATLTREALAARRAAQPDRIRSLVLADTAAGSTAEVRRGVEKLKTEQMALLAARDGEAYLQAQTTRWTVGTGVVLNFLLLGLAGWLVRDDVRARRRAAEVLHEANERLELRVRERTTELANANEVLRAENLERAWGSQALEHQLRYNELIVNSISDLVFVLTKAQNISRLNPAVTHATGFETKELVNRPLQSLVRLGGAARPAGFDPLAQALREGREYREAEAFVQDRSGRETPVSFRLFPLRDRDRVVGGVVILRTRDTGA
jgi:PAS domain S-box-containing protein